MLIFYKELHRDVPHHLTLSISPNDMILTVVGVKAANEAVTVGGYHVWELKLWIVYWGYQKHPKYGGNK